MKTLLISDLHWSDGKYDQYRFDVVSKLTEIINKHSIQNVIHLGDLTEKKDNHSAELVNKIVDNLAILRGKLPRDGRLILLKGNHDYKLGRAFFDFIELVPGFVFISAALSYKELGSLFLPHTKNLQEWDNLVSVSPRFIFMHQLFNGAVTCNGKQIPGGENNFLPACWNKSKIFSGDVHNPQTLGRIEYVGAPYPIDFGDEYEPRVIVLDTETGKQRSIGIKSIKKTTIEAEYDADITNEFEGGDQVKLRIRLPRACFSDWPKIKQRFVSELTDNGVIVRGVEMIEQDNTIRHTRLVEITETEPKQILKEFCKVMKVEDEACVKVGWELLA